MKEQIDAALRRLKEVEAITVLYACESGSRAWGFASPDSDYDLRFIYAHPADWHLRLEKRTDFIDLMLPNDLDLSGWELAKTLRLFATCNLALNEWLDSPVVYAEPNEFKKELQSLVPAFFNPRKAMHHYLSMARRTAEENFDGPRIKIKKLFYILRPLFACQWIRANLSMPPTVFQTMLEARLAPADLLEAVAEIQKQKETAAEKHVIEAPRIITAWIEGTISDSESAAEALPPNEKASWDPLNELMLKRTPR